MALGATLFPLVASFVHRFLTFRDQRIADFSIDFHKFFVLLFGFLQNLGGNAWFAFLNVSNRSLHTISDLVHFLVDGRPLALSTYNFKFTVQIKFCV